MSCKEFREMLGPYLDEALEEGEMRAFREHLRQCAECRGWAVAEDPSLLFVLTPEVAPDPAKIEECAVAVTAQIRQRRLSRRLHRRRNRWLAAAAAMMIVAGGGVIWKTQLGGNGGSEPAAFEASAGVEPPTTPPTVEVEMAGEDVRVYQFAADTDDDTAVYFVVNPAMEL